MRPSATQTGRAARFGNALFVILLVGLGLLFVGRSLFGGGVAETPAIFAAGLTLDEAVAQAEASDRVVFAVVTADWCPPCQDYKRGTLSDARVESWIDANAVPVFINADAQPQDAAELGARAIPLTAVVRNGQVLDARPGDLPPDELLSWLERYRATPQ